MMRRLQLRRQQGKSPEYLKGGCFKASLLVEWWTDGADGMLEGPVA